MSQNQLFIGIRSRTNIISNILFRIFIINKTKLIDYIIIDKYYISIKFRNNFFKLLYMISDFWSENVILI